jgi:Arc/MetJ-type ribon-helix-helix transcriptional regulator
MYDRCDVIRYALDDLKKFRAEHTIRPGRKTK